MQSVLPHEVDTFGNWLRSQAASDRVRSLVFLPVAGFGLDLDFVLAEKTLLVVYFLIFNRIQTGVGFLECRWYRIRSGIGFKICKTKLEPDSKNQSPHTFGILQDIQF